MVKSNRNRKSQQWQWSWKNIEEMVPENFPNLVKNKPINWTPHSINPKKSIPTGRFCFSSRSCSPVTVSQLWPGLYMWQLCRIPPSVSFSNPCYVSKLIWWLQQCPTHNSFISTTDRVHPVLLDISEFPMTQDTSAVSSKDPANPNAPNQCHLLSRGFWYPWSVTCPNSHQGHKLDTMESPSNPFPAITGDGIVWS